MSTWDLTEFWRITTACKEGRHEDCDRVDCCCVQCHDWFPID